MGYSDTKLNFLVSKRLGESRGFDHFLARTPAQREAIFKLRYDAYYSQGLIYGNDESSLSDWQDDEKTSLIYGITLHGRLVSTIRLSVISRTQKACLTYSMFKNHCDSIVDKGESILDGSRLAVNCSSALRRSVILYTLSLTAACSVSVNATWGSIIARHRHAPFYERYGFDLVIGPFTYPGARASTSLMMIELPVSTMSHLSGTHKNRMEGLQLSA
ncbi:hypothetical protein JSE7799_00543 [Jannaschia seosinensis]|uniref:N-acyl amino acid synthase FeeM catalytic core domain-containing protein n=1 Tax=Jannaschia seosinensis TaxID=313367 RepID=A0A0M7B7R0_9RHOB|nr:hypothetical protein JSE7799_00543 [Jannaschia seosinensis]